MSDTDVSLRDYQAAERVMAHENATTGVVAHAIVTMLVGAGLVVINVVLADEFPWSAFAVGGMLIGLLAHWWFGYIKLDQQLAKQQRRTETRAAHLT